MKKKGYVVGLILLIFILLIQFAPNSTVKAQSTTGCCSNPSTTIYGAFYNSYCSDTEGTTLSQNECCPADGTYHNESAIYPKNQTDCQLNYWRDGACVTLLQCQGGCCYDNTTVNKCGENTQFQCLNASESNLWEPGYNVVDRLNNNPCYKDELDSSGFYKEKIEECPDIDPCTGNGITKDECLEKSYQSNSCVYCPEAAASGGGSCFTECSHGCMAYSTDFDGDNICDADSQNYDICRTDELICERPVLEDCRCGTELAEKDEYCCMIRSQAYPTQNSCTGDCHPDCYVNSTILSTEQDYGIDFGGVYSYCYCGGTLVNFENEGFCCDFGNEFNNYTNEKCYQIGSVEGTVTDQDTADPIPGAQVSVSVKTTATDDSGYYMIKDIIVGNHDLEVSSVNYKTATKTITLTTDGETITENFPLEPTVPRCENPFVTPPDINPYLECSNELGTLTVRWTDPCPETIMGFYVYRNTHLQAFTKNTFFIDDTFPWSTSVTYKVGVMYDYGKTYNYTLPVFLTGDPTCIDKGGQEMCINNSRYECTGCFALGLRQNCGASTCVGPSSNGKTLCKPEASCKDFGDPFGAFYTSDQCLGVQLDPPFSGFYSNPCYFDYSLTPIDYCYSCAADTTCYDYKSKASCEIDNCVVGGSDRCQYLETNAELGKGICFSENSEVSDCGLCNDPFMDCSAQQCSMLGSCYLSGSQCEGCDGTVSCEDYEDEVSCTGGQEFQVLNHLCDAYKTRTYSEDACGVGYCQWRSNQCIRAPEAPTVGFSEPETTAHFSPPGLMTNGTNITFSVDPIESITYACIDKDGLCCPDTELNPKLMILPAGYSLGEGWYTLSYYSRDFYGNYEPVNKEAFYFDGLPPQININYTVSNGSELKSNVEIDISLNEMAQCRENILPMDYDDPNTIHAQQGFSRLFRAKYFDLYDGTHLYNISCTDMSGNEVTIYQNINIDRLALIFNEEPVGGVYTGGPVTFRVKTSKQANCRYAREINGKIVGNYQTLPEKSHETTPFDHYIYEKLITETISDTFFYNVKCDQVNGDLEDNAKLYFSYDNLGPRTKLVYTWNAGQEDYVSSNWYPENADFDFSCADEPELLGFGCKQTKYCVGDDCTPDSVGLSIVVPESRYYCYRSEDLGGNLGETTCSHIKIDNTVPTKPKVNDTSEDRYNPEHTFRQNKLRAWFSSYDNESGIDHYVYQIVSDKGDVVVKWSQTKEHEDWFWITDSNSNWVEDENEDPILLENNTKYYIKVFAVDKIGKKSANVTSDGITVDTSKVKATCTDGKLNGDETNVDCGGSCPACSTKPKYCGDNEVNRAREECDGSDLELKACSDFDDYDEGVGRLKCHSDCTFDFSGCYPNNPKCGDGVVNRIKEDCDKLDLKGLNCHDFGYGGGTLKCDSSCDFDTGSCTYPKNDVCQDGDKNREEECDSPDLANKDCTDFDDYLGGDLDCTSDCLFDTTDCDGLEDPKCGDDDINQITEVCDKDDLANRDCEYFGYAEGTLSCKSNCEFDFSGCVIEEIDCDDDDDCESDFCHPVSNICMSPSCSDGFENQDETDVDCGGICSTKCEKGEGCRNDYDCEDRYCNQRTGKCEGEQGDHCLNGNYDQVTETDIDCGKECPACSPGKMCEEDLDCESGKCENNECAEPTCFDTIMNSHESDIDCGGLCPGCDEGEKCFTDTDCLSGNCKSSICSKSDDADNDGLPDWWEDQYCNGDCDPYADPDKDGLTNFNEFINNANPFNDDTDGDGYKDGKEVDKGYLPDDPDSHPRSSFLLIFILFLLALAILGLVVYTLKNKKKPKPPKPVSKPPKTLPPKPLGKPTSATKLEQIAKPHINRTKDKYAKRRHMFNEFGSTTPTLDKLIQKQGKGYDLTGDVWNRLNTMNVVEMQRMNLSPQQVHNQLGKLYGKKLSKESLNVLSKLVESNYVTKDNLVAEFSKLSKEGKFSLAVLKKVLSSMKKNKHISKKELDAHLGKLHEQKVITKNDKEDILHYLK